MHKILLLSLSLWCIHSPSLQAFVPYYAEDFLSLYHSHLILREEDIFRNISYLRKALLRPFSYTPLKNTPSISPQQLQKYRLLQRMHTYLLLIRQYTLLAGLYEKRFKAPTVHAYQETLLQAQTSYQKALEWWDSAYAQAVQASTPELVWVIVPHSQELEDQRRQIVQNAFVYPQALHRYLEQIEDKIRSPQAFTQDQG